jgi:hypothetical protein
MTEAAHEQIKRELDEALDTMRSELDRVELLAAALNVFGHPIPDYQPRFHHLNRVALRAQELGKAGGPKP